MKHVRLFGIKLSHSDVITPRITSDKWTESLPFMRYYIIVTFCALLFLLFTIQQL